MVTRVTQTAEGLALLLSPDIIKSLHLDADTPLEITAAGDSLIVTPILDAERRARFRAALQETNEQFGEALRHLAE